MHVEPLHPVGARVTGLTLAGVDDAQVDELRAVLATHGVVVLPGQDDATDDHFVSFLRRFGPLAFTKGEAHAPGQPDLNVVSNVGRTVAPRSAWHVDTSYVREPPAYTALRAVLIPERGGATLFTDQGRALDTLDRGLREAIDGRDILHVVTGVELEPGDESESWHPIVRPHPVTGRPGLYLTSPKRCARVSGLDEDRSREIVAELLEHSTAPDNVYAHAWAPGDVVLWDNARVLHRADHADVRGDRVMHRGMVASYRAA